MVRLSSLALLLAATAALADPASDAETLSKARTHLKFGQPDLAAQLLEPLLLTKPANSEVIYVAAKAYLEMESPTRAWPLVERYLAEDPEDQSAWLVRGKIASLQGRTELEIESYQKALELDPEYGDAHFLLALAYDKVKNHPKTFEHAQRAIRIDPYFKEKLKPRIKDSNVAKKIGSIVTQVLEDSKYERLTDEKIEEYAEEIGRILGKDAGPVMNIPGMIEIRRSLQFIRGGEGAEFGATPVPVVELERMAGIFEAHGIPLPDWLAARLVTAGLRPPRPPPPPPPTILLPPPPSGPNRAPGNDVPSNPATAPGPESPAGKPADQGFLGVPAPEPAPAPVPGP